MTPWQVVVLAVGAVWVGWLIVRLLLLWSRVARQVTAAHEGLTAPCETCGVTDMAGVNLKALRHRVATEATRLAGARVAAALVGHASPVMTQNVYGHSRRDDGREVADQLSAGLPQLGA